QGFRSDLTVLVEAGRIAALEPGLSGQRLPGRALLPGAVNAHSHTFQRAIRGRTEYRQPGRESEDFWTWRERMYQAANRLSPEEVESVARLCFIEMLLAGITCVGEFHYLQHQPDGTPYAEPDELALRVAAAAERAGIDLVLLRVGYARAGYGCPPNPLQARFIDPNPEFALGAVERLRQRGLKVGLAPHSLRAVPLDWLRVYGDYARQHGLPLHMHVSEQPREVEEVVQEHGHRPVLLLQREGWLDERFCAVHAIHLEDVEVAALADCFVCSCPTTERNLGDGTVAADRLLAAGTRLCLGTDSQCQIDLYEDARQLEYHLRLRDRQRAVLGDPAARLWSALNRNGAASLGVSAGSIQPGQAADLVAVRLDDPSLAGAPVQDLLPTLLFGLSRSAIDRVWVSGRPVVTDGRHPGQEDAVRDFQRVMEGLR
ncbi:MAG: formimidoylglutamate deiminase, partial [Candidatus Eremiobacterota bacterium]